MIYFDEKHLSNFNANSVKLQSTSLKIHTQGQGGRAFEAVVLHLSNKLTDFLDCGPMGSIVTQ